MRQSFAIGFGLLVASLSITGAIAQNSQHQENKPQERTRPATKPSTPAKNSPRTPGNSQRPTRQPGGRAANQPAQNRPTQNRPAQTRPVQSRPTQNRPTQGRPSQNRPSQPTVTQGWRNQRLVRDQTLVRADNNRLNPNWTENRPRYGQVVLLGNSDWSPNYSHRYNSSIYLGTNVWAVSSFPYGGEVVRWSPSTWHYWVGDSLMTIVYRSERMSNSLISSLEGKVTRDGLAATAGGQRAWDRLQTLDQALEKLRSETGNVSDVEMRDGANDALSCAQQVVRSFNAHPNLQALVRYEWDDLHFELNELARYYNEPVL